MDWLTVGTADALAVALPCVIPQQNGQQQNGQLELPLHRLWLLFLPLKLNFFPAKIDSFSFDVFL